MDAQTGLAAVTGFDWVVLALVGLLAVGGLLQGFTAGLLGLLAWVAAVFAVRLFHEAATGFLAPVVGGEGTAAFLAFLLLFFGTLLLGRALAAAAGGAARRSAVVGPVDRVLGLGLGALKGVLLAAALFVLAQFATGLFDDDRTPPRWLAGARSAPALTAIGGAMVTWLEDGFAVIRPDPLEPPRPGRVPPLPALPPGHPPVPGVPGPDDTGGQTREERDALDRLLREGASDEVEI